MLRDWLGVGAASSAFLLGSVAYASEPASLGLPVVAADSQWSSAGGGESEIETDSEANAHPADERWREKPISIGLSTIMGPPTGEAEPFFMLGGELAYALPYVSLAGTVGYTVGVNASLAARLRWHLGHAVALTLGGRAALLPLDDACGFFEDHCEQVRRWEEAYFGGGELGVEGRTRAGFMWRAQVGYWQLLAHGPGTCRIPFSKLGCSAGDPPESSFVTEELVVGWAF